MSSTRSFVARTLMWAGVACAATGVTVAPAAAEALLVIEADSGKVIFAHNAGQPWYPASTTKLMTTYVTLRAVKEGRITLDRPLVVSANAAAQSPVKMGFPPGTVITVDNALKMLMVKSANDMAVVLAEGVAGSVENFADEMNNNARRLGMIQSSFVNPNGLPADDQIVSARDMAILARALIREMPEYDYFWHLPGIRLGKMVQRNYNTLLGRYPGADGMKTGFICASGFQPRRHGHARRPAADRCGARRSLVGGARLEGCAASGARLQQQQRVVMADAVARHGEIAAAGRRGAAEPARRNVRRPPQTAGHRGRGRGDRGEQQSRLALRGFPVQPAIPRRPRVRPRCCRMPRWASRSSSIPAPSRRRRDR